MLPNPRFAVACLAAVLTCPPVTGRAQSAEQEQRIAASFVLALGRTPTRVELEEWTKQEPLPLAGLLARHRRRLEENPVAQQAVVVKGSQDAFGRAPAEENANRLTDAGTYTEVVERHLRWLAERPAEYEQVVHRAYRLVLQRDAYAVEIEYWRHQPVLSFALLVACVEDWARRNQPGLTATTGVAAASVNSAYLATVRLSPAVAAEARLAAGLPRAGDRALAAAAGRNLVAPGARDVASVGGIPFAAAGAEDLASAIVKR